MHQQKAAALKQPEGHSAYELDMIEPPYSFSPRERQVIHLAACGMTDEGICNVLEIAAGTLGTYWVRIRNKCGRVSRTEVACAFIQAQADQRTIELYERLTASTVRDNALLRATDISGNAVMLLDSRSQVVIANKTAADMFGLKSLTGFHLRTFLGSSADLLQRAINLSKPDIGPVVVYLNLRAGRTKWLVRRDRYLQVLLVGMFIA